MNQYLSNLVWHLLGSKAVYLICLEIGTIQWKLSSICCPTGYLHIDVCKHLEQKKGGEHNCFNQHF